CQQYNDLLSSF
nr:immunoglobulin light chain junction region [Macaca mulatta]